MAQSKRSIQDRIKELQAKEAKQKAKTDRVKQIKSHQDAIARLRKAK